ncbi:MAG: HAD-IA family hydrolase [Pseudomonadota bacterium]|nr:HAD-IA family hydrolase [Pseudomonadota bacterium]
MTARRIVIFDWDGTLADSLGRIHGAMGRAAESEGLPCPSVAAVNEVVGLSIREALALLHPGVGPGAVERLRIAYGDAFRALDAEPVPLFPGISELLAALGDIGVAMAVATGKSRAGLRRSLDQTALETRFEAVRCGDECRSKPHPQMVEELLAAMGAVPEDAVLVGDSTHDMAMAAAAGVAAIGVSYGACTAQRLSAFKPIVVVNDADALGHAIACWVNR